MLERTGAAFEDGVPLTVVGRPLRAGDAAVAAARPAARAAAAAPR